MRMCWAEVLSRSNLCLCEDVRDELEECFTFLINTFKILQNAAILRKNNMD